MLHDLLNHRVVGIEQNEIVPDRILEIVNYVISRVGLFGHVNTLHNVANNEQSAYEKDGQSQFEQSAQ